MLKTLLFLAFLFFPFISFAEGTAAYFEGMDGCFLLYNLKTGTFQKVVGQPRCRQMLPACSTFKVALSVIAFDAGLLKDEYQMLKWNGIKDTREVSNRDHNARTWIRDSIVWFSQRLTNQLGPKKLKHYLRRLHYGNEDISGGLTQAWLIAPDSSTPALKISAYDQVVFMSSLWLNKLPVSAYAMKVTRDLTYLETSPKGFQLSGKTGSNSYQHDPRLRLGWFVAHIQKDDQEYIAVTNFSDLTAPSDSLYGGMKAKEITKSFLAEEGLW